eukprot:TRINITY_DN10631_c0_g1_i1.p1 TRINITY_DN10631_c0_g1~~TRINITY_DN10631_c0_g1_i1.p1  ORF type:complete len:144 (-),score=40.22 TRINITY_DN10631_c0_g1_i1:62-493(-)
MSRNRKSQEMPNPQDAPPSYDETIKNKAGGFVYPEGSYPPPQGANPPGYTPGVKTVVQVVQVPAPDLGCHAVRMVCQNCQMSITTETSSSPSVMAWGLSAILCFTMLWPCFCAPFCVSSLQNVKHKCPSCKTVLGRYKGCGVD